MSEAAGRASPVGVLVIDKPGGATSHDVVATVRRRLGLRRVGHAGTLDPMATGVLVVMVGEATKLAPYLSGVDKRYRAVIQLGWATDSCDADGAEISRGPTPAWWADDAQARRRLDAILAVERGRLAQSPPVLSAIKLGGRPAHRRVRAGEQITLADRPVRIERLELSARHTTRQQLELELSASKGYYVRALARDIGEALDWPAHLCALRRTHSGPFTLDDATPPDHPALRRRLLTMEQAARAAMPTAALTAEGARRARHGGPMAAPHFTRPPEPAGPTAWLDERGRLCAIGEARSEGLQVLRAFVSSDA